MSSSEGPISGEGYAAGHLDDMGEGPGFRKVRRHLEVKELGVNAIVAPPGVSAPGHYHDEQEELYFVHKGQLELGFPDGRKVILGEGGVARVDAQTARTIANPGSDEAVWFIVGAKGGYVGRDGHEVERTAE